MYIVEPVLTNQFFRVTFGGGGGGGRGLWLLINSNIVLSVEQFGRIFFFRGLCSSVNQAKCPLGF